MAGVIVARPSGLIECGTGALRTKIERFRIAKNRRARPHREIAKAITVLVSKGPEHTDIVRGVGIAPQQCARRGSRIRADNTAGIVRDKKWKTPSRSAVNGTRQGKAGF